MRLMYVGYWSAAEPLTAATILPHLRVLASYPEVEEIVFCTIERNGSVPPLSLPRITHVPLTSKSKGLVIFSRAREYFSILRELRRICMTSSIDLILCRSALAGAFGHRLKKLFGIPYVVESFEPHRDYMVDSGIWKWYDPRALFQQISERNQKRSASYLLPVSMNYERRLRRQRVPSERIIPLPCCVDTSEFAFDQEARIRIRRENNTPNNAVVGIYVGKFGGIYYEYEAFRLYKSAFDFFGDSFRLVILSGHEEKEVRTMLQRAGIPEHRVILRFVPHGQVNDWLSAADFAFCTIKPAPSRMFCSPVKNGEYWACGLPIIIEPRIGDDSDIIGTQGGGVVLQRDNPHHAFKEIKKLLSLGRASLAESIRPVALQYRHLDLVKAAYDRVLFNRW